LSFDEFEAAYKDLYTLLERPRGYERVQDVINALKKYYFQKEIIKQKLGLE
jgi:hypothetical protein